MGGGCLVTHQEIQIIPSIILKQNVYEKESLYSKKELRIKETTSKIEREETFSFLKSSKISQNITKDIVLRKYNIVFL